MQLNPTEALLNIKPGTKTSPFSIIRNGGEFQVRQHFEHFIRHYNGPRPTTHCACYPLSPTADIDHPADPLFQSPPKQVLSILGTLKHLVVSQAFALPDSGRILSQTLPSNPPRLPNMINIDCHTPSPHGRSYLNLQLYRGRYRRLL